MGPKHGSLAKSGKVRKQTPKVAKQEKQRKPKGRAYQRMQYRKRFETVLPGKKNRSPNWNSGRP